MAGEDEVWFCYEESSGAEDVWTYRFRRYIGGPGSELHHLDRPETVEEDEEKVVEGDAESFRAGAYYDGNLKHLPGF